MLGRFLLARFLLGSFLLDAVGDLSTPGLGWPLLAGRAQDRPNVSDNDYTLRAGEVVVKGGGGKTKEEEEKTKPKHI